MTTKAERRRRRQQRRLQASPTAVRLVAGLSRRKGVRRLATVGLMLAVALAAFLLLRLVGSPGGEPATLLDPVRNEANQGLSVSAREGQTAPNFEATDRQGRRIRLSDFQGRVVMLNFYASWCTPCAKEMPAIDRVYRELKERGFEVLGVNLKERKSDAFGFLDSLGVSYNAVLDPDGTIAERYRVLGPPVSVFIDRNGIVRYYLPGELRASQVQQVVTSMLSDSGIVEDVTPVGTPVAPPLSGGN